MPKRKAEPDAQSVTKRFPGRWENPDYYRAGVLEMQLTRLWYGKLSEHIGMALCNHMDHHHNTFHHDWRSDIAFPNMKKHLLRRARELLRDLFTDRDGSLSELVDLAEEDARKDQLEMQLTIEPDLADRMDLLPPK